MKKLPHQRALLTASACLLLFSQNANCENLQQAVDIAKANNRNIKLERIRLDATKTTKTQAISEFLPSVKGNIQYGNRNSFYQGQTYDRSGKQRSEELSVEQPLFDGLHSVSKYREADLKIKSGSSKTSDKVQEVSFLAIQAYCNLFRYQEILKLQEENKKLANKFLALVQRRKEARIIDKSDIIKFTYEASINEEKYLDALNRLNKAKFDYKTIVGELHENLVNPQITEENFEAQKVLETVTNNNHNIRSYHYNYLASKASYNAEKSTFAPKVSLTASTNKQTNVLYLNGKDLDSRSVFVNVSIPIFQKGVEYANLQKAGYDRDAAREEYEITKENVVKEVNQALEEYAFFQQMNKTNKNLFELAKNRAEIFTKRSAKKVEDPIESIRVKIEANEREINYIDSQMELVIAHYKIKYFLGEI